ncbi:MAG: hypothetical protein WDO69_22725 [Pseudomonadota bacterium]
MHSPHHYLKLAIEPQLGHWDRVNQHPMAGRPDGEHILPKALAAIELLKGLLAKLEGKTGERADDARNSISAQLAAITKAVEHFHSLGVNLDGPLALELEAKIVACRQAQGAAAHAKYNAVDRDAIREALLDVECAELEVRAVDRAVAEAVKKLGLPSLPSEQAVIDAEGATHDLERFPKTKNTAANIKSAIEHGQRGGAQADYWIIFETGTHELTDWRWRGHVGT